MQRSSENESVTLEAKLRLLADKKGWVSMVWYAGAGKSTDLLNGGVIEQTPIPCIPVESSGLKPKREGV